MLSIGKLATGQANYYLEQADGRIDRASSVASGVEDYYLGGGEAVGDWIGSGIIELGLAGRVDAEPLHRVLAGEHPATGDALRASRRVRVPGFDLTFSAPKSVSVLLASAMTRSGQRSKRLRMWRFATRLVIWSGRRRTYAVATMDCT